MVGGNISSEKIDLLIYGPSKPIVENGFSDQFVLHTVRDQARPRAIDARELEKIRGIAVTYNTVRPTRRRWRAFRSSKSSQASASVTTTSIPLTPVNITSSSPIRLTC